MIKHEVEVTRPRMMINDQIMIFGIFRITHFEEAWQIWPDNCKIFDSFAIAKDWGVDQLHVVGVSCARGGGRSRAAGAAGRAEGRGRRGEGRQRLPAGGHAGGG